MELGKGTKKGGVIRRPWENSQTLCTKNIPREFDGGKKKLKESDEGPTPGQRLKTSL